MLLSARLNLAVVTAVHSFCVPLRVRVQPQAIAAMGFSFMYSPRLGYLHSCPSNCGTGMRASVHVRLPLLAKTGELPLLCEQLRLQPRGVDGEHSDSAGGVYDISNKERLGKSELQLVQSMIFGVRTLIERERELEEDAQKCSN